MRESCSPSTSGNPKSEGWDYFNATITVDWKGWKCFTLIFSRMHRARSPVGWSKIDHIAFHAGGWGHTPRADTALFFDDMRLVRLPRITRTFQDIRCGCLYELEVLVRAAAVINVLRVGKAPPAGAPKSPRLPPDELVV